MNILVLALLVVIAAGCTPARSGERAAESPVGSEAAGAPKVITIAILREPNSFHRDLTQGTGATGGNAQVLSIPQNYLAVQTDSGAFEAQLAAEQISAERGTWVVNADG